MPNGITDRPATEADHADAQSQVQTGAANDNPLGDGHNRFSLRAFGSGASDNAAIAISGLTEMAMYADLPSSHTSFYLTQVPPDLAQTFSTVRQAQGALIKAVSELGGAKRSAHADTLHGECRLSPAPPA